MPKPLFGDNGSGMHSHQIAVEGRQALFDGDGYAGSARLALYYIGGLLKHAPALLAFCEPDHQLLQAPGAGLRGAGEPRVLGRATAPPRCRIPMYSTPQGQAHRVPLPDPSATPTWPSRRC